MFDNEQSALLGVILDFKKDRFRILNERSREVELAPARLHRIPCSMPATAQSRDQQVAFLQSLRCDAEKVVGSIAIDELWAVVKDSPREWSERELGELLYGTPSPVQYLSLRLALMADRIYFKRDRLGFLPRSVEVIEELKRAEQVRHEKKQLELQTVEFISQRLEGNTVAIPERLGGIINLLEECAAASERIDHARQREVKDLLQLFSDRTGIELRGSIEERSFELLCRIGHFNKNTNLIIYRHNPRRNFSAEALDAAQQLRVPQSIEEMPPSYRGKVRDITALELVTIDDSSTHDMDDALSIEQTQSGYRLGIHISNVALAIQPDSVLEREAALRATSIYNSDLTLNMLPDLLAEDKLSLVAGQVRPAVSCFFDLDHRLSVTRGSLELTLVRVARKLSYDEVDTFLANEDHDLSLLYNIASQKEQERIEGGAVRVQKSDAMTVIAPDGSLALVEIDEQSPARSLVGEMMVMANSFMARFAAERKLPLVFRGQPQPDRGRTIDPRIPEGPARDYAIRSLLKKSTISFSPQSHASLGLEAYAQITSPIRRFADLINQRQIIEAIIADRGYYSADDLEQWVYKIEEPLNKATQISRQSKRFWLLRYLEERMANSREIQGTVIRTDLKNPVVELRELFITVPVRTERELRPGDEVLLRIVSVKPQDDQVRLEVIG